MSISCMSCGCVTSIPGPKVGQRSCCNCGALVTSNVEPGKIRMGDHVTDLCRRFAAAADVGEPWSSGDLGVEIRIMLAGMELERAEGVYKRKPDALTARAVDNAREQVRAWTAKRAPLARADSTNPHPLKAARRCPRCGRNAFHFVERWTRDGAKASMCCGNCGHRWAGRLSRAERDLPERA